MQQESAPRGPPSTRPGSLSWGGRGRGRGRGRGLPSNAQQENISPGTRQRGASTSTFRGPRGRDARTQGHNTSSQRFASPLPSATTTQCMPVLPTDVSPDQIKAHNKDKIVARREKLKEHYNQLRENAITNGLMSSDEQSTIDAAIKTRGICTQMCDEKERVERIFNNSVALEETLPHPDTGHPVAIEGRMVKTFRRSAAGTDRQIPEELRTAKTCWKTLNYLFKDILGSDPRLGKHHKFVWDRTRALRNDFSIQSFTKSADVKFEVACLEGIVRFHVLSLHQMSRPDQVQSHEEYSRQQEIAQLKATFTSLLEKYQTFADTMRFNNEPEFRAYFILFAARTDLFDMDVQFQTWPKHVLDDGRVQTALRLHAASTTIDIPVGSHKLGAIPASVAQCNAGLYWSLLSSNQVGYLMACAAEMSFQIIRFTALNALWRSAKAAREASQKTMRSWTLDVLTEYLGFDTAEQTEDFCKVCGADFAHNSTTNEPYLDFGSTPESSLTQPRFDPTSSDSHIFSESIVEQKRHGRTYTAILRGMSVVQAQRADMIEKEDTIPFETLITSNPMFVGDGDDADEFGVESESKVAATVTDSQLNTGAVAFPPGTSTVPQPPRWITDFGKPKSSDMVSPDGPPPGLFGPQKNKQEPKNFVAPQSPFPVWNSAKPQSPFANNPLIPASAGAESGNLPTAVEVSITPAVTARPTAFAFDSKIATPPQQAQWQDQLQRVPVTSSVERAVNTQSTEVPGFTFSSASVSAPSVETSLPEASAANPPTTGLGSGSDSFIPKSSPSVSLVPHTSASTEPIKPFQFHFGTESKQALPPTAPQTGNSKGFTSSLGASPTHGSSDSPFPESLASGGFTAQDSTLPLQTTPRVEAALTSTTPTSSSVQLNSALPTFITNELSKSSLPDGDDSSRSQSQTSTIINQSRPRHQLVTPEPVDEAKLHHQLCRIGLVQQDGILDNFVNMRVSELVQDVYRRYQNQRLQNEIDIVKAKILKRKYFALWIASVARRRLTRKAEKRRKMLVATVKAQEEKTRQETRDLVRILHADRIRKSLQEEQNKRKQTEMLQKDEQRVLQAHSKSLPQLERPSDKMLVQQVGQKRKNLMHSTSRSNMQDISQSPIHKRSKTLESSAAIDTASQESTWIIPPTTQARLIGSTDLRRSLSHRSLNLSSTQKGRDQTQTDYFRLKAYGVDPDTPFTPHTSTSLALKKQRDEERGEQSLDRILRRSSSKFGASLSSRASTRSIEPEITPHPATVMSEFGMDIQSRTAVEEDPVMKAAREFRKTLAAITDEQREENKLLQREIEEQEVQEQLRRSQASNTSADDAYHLTPSIHGFTSNGSGYEYTPPDLKPGQTLSRTEERIRRTGARGLANKPIGGSAKASPIPEYSPVAMSRRTAAALNQSDSMPYLPITNGRGRSHSSKRSFEDIVGPQSVAITNLNGGHMEIRPEITPQMSKKLKNGDVVASELQSLPNKHYTNGSEYYEEDEADAADTPDEEEASDHNDVSYSAIDLENLHGDLRQDDGEYTGDEGLEEQYGEEPEEEEEEELEEEEEDKDEDEEETDIEAEDENGNSHAPHYYPQPGRYPHSDLPTEEEYSGDYEESGDDEESPGEYDEDGDANGSDLSVPRHDSRVASAATPDTGFGSTADDAIELSD